MQSPNRAYVPQIDELRGFAALLVFYFHAEILGFWALGHTGWLRAATPLEALVYEGHTGVALFMVLSGFILAKGVIGRPISYGSFLRNRLLRIAPLTVLVTLFAIYGNRGVSLDRIAAPFLLLQNAAPPIAFEDRTGLSATVWTVATEFQFYLLAPFLFAFVARDGVRRFLLPSLVLVFALKLLVMLPNRALTDLWAIPYFSLVGRLNQFLLGIGLAAVWPRLISAQEVRGPMLGWALLAAGLVGAFGLAFLVNRTGGQYAWQTWRYALQDIEGLVWVLFIGGYVLVDPLRGVRRLRRAAVGLGLVSFSFYILHWAVLTGSLRGLPLIGIALPDDRALLALLATVTVLPLTIALAALSYWCVERPFLLSRSRYVGEEAPINSPP